MEVIIAMAIGILFGALVVSAVRVVWLRERGQTPKRKSHTAWMTRQQLLVLESVAKTGRAGIRLWFTDINLSTLRSLSKRGLVDTRSGGRIVATRSGKKRLDQAWPDRPSTSDQKGTESGHGSNVQAIAPEASGEASTRRPLT